MSEKRPKKRGPGRPIQKGQVLNPLGAGAHNKELKQLKKLTNETIASMGTLVLEGNLKALEEIRDNKSSTVLQIWIASVAVKAISKGDMFALNALLDRLVGKVKEKVELSGNAAPQIVLTMPDNGRSAKDLPDISVNGTTVPLPAVLPDVDSNGS